MALLSAIVARLSHLKPEFFSPFILRRFRRFGSFHVTGDYAKEA
jgi:hypothetical protein